MIDLKEASWDECVRYIETQQECIVMLEQMRGQVQGANATLVDGARHGTAGRARVDLNAYVQGTHTRGTGGEWYSTAVALC